MLASLLPGLREVRAPLAAGFIWLLFGYVALGSPASVAEESRAVGDVVDVVDSFGAAAMGVAISFVAYLVGSLSQDVFGRVLPRGVVWLARVLPVNDPRLGALEWHVSWLNTFFDEWRSGAAEGADTEDIREALEKALARVEAASGVVREMERAGATETEKPEALRPMLEAEGNLRLAVVPPFIALFICLAVTDSLLWLLGVLFSLALYGQAAFRHVEASLLAAQHDRIRPAGNLYLQLHNVKNALGVSPDTAVLRWFEIDWEPLLGRTRVVRFARDRVPAATADAKG